MWPLLIVVAVLAVWLSLQLSQPPPSTEPSADAAPITGTRPPTALA